jgi:hypothetical protein
VEGRDFYWQRMQHTARMERRKASEATKN